MEYIEKKAIVFRIIRNSQDQANPKQIISYIKDAIPDILPKEITMILDELTENAI